MSRYNHTICIEGSTCDYPNKYHNDISNEGKLKIGFESCFSYDTNANSATTFEHMKCFFHWMYENNFFITYNIIYDTKDGCKNKNWCANAMWLLSVVEFTYIMIIYIWNNTPGRRISKVDGINLYDKTYLKPKIWMIGTEESDS